jgi:lipase
MTRRQVDVPVRGGLLHTGVWESPGLGPDDTAARTILAVHGVTSSHLAWGLVADRLTVTPGTRVVAPDLRGRGRSNHLPGPWGMDQHADDLLAVTNVLGHPDLTTGHSMGGFAVVVAAYRHPGCFGELLLLDGGVPLPFPAGVPVEQVLSDVLGPAARRLSMTFPDHAAHREFWRAHPAFADAWSEPEQAAAVQAYVDHDLEPTPNGWRSAARYEAVVADSAEQGPGGTLEAAWAAMTSPPTFLRSPLGLLAEPPGLYPEQALVAFAQDRPGFTWKDVTGTNHYTLVLSPAGADRVRDTVHHVLGHPPQIAVTSTRAASSS